ncbi:MAG: leucine-rich repeat domain-containing protein, partial [Bacteroidota bacterium]
PSIISEFSGLKSLNLSRCNMQHLPKSLVELTALEDLSLQNNRFSTFPEFIGEMENLSAINLTQNPYEQFPEFLARLPKLTSFVLDFGRMEGAAGLEKCQQFRTLHLSQSREFELPDELFELRKLQTLHIFRKEMGPEPRFLRLGDLVDLKIVCPSEVVWSEAWDSLPALEVLELRGNTFEGKMPNWGKMKALQRLSLKGEMADLPNLEPAESALRVLSISNSRSTQFPESYGLFPKLEELKLSNANFGEFPTTVLQLEGLRTLRFRNCGIKSLPSEISQLTNLKTLDLSRNPLREVPVSLFHMVHLETLQLDNTHLPLEQVFALRNALPYTQVNMRK